MKNKFKIILIVFTFICFGIIFMIPCIYHPFSCHDCYDWGYKEATGHFPDSTTELLLKK